MNSLTRLLSQMIAVNIAEIPPANFSRRRSDCKSAGSVLNFAGCYRLQIALEEMVASLYEKVQHKA